MTGQRSGKPTVFGRVVRWIAVVGFIISAVVTSVSIAQNRLDLALSEMEDVIKRLEDLLVRLKANRSRQPGVVVAGFIAAVVTGEREGRKFRSVYVPGIDVYLEEPGGFSSAPPQQTDLSGRFTFRNLRAGSYRLCWKADGYAPGCRPFTVQSDNLHLGDTVVFAERDDESVLVWGEVRLSDGSKPRFLDPLVGRNAYATVELNEPARNTTKSVAVNNFAQYVIPVASSRSDIELSISIEAAKGFQRVLAGAELFRAATHRIDIVIENSAPKWMTAAASDGSGLKLKTALPGSTLKLVAQAEDPDGDQLDYTWYVMEGSGVLNTANGPNADWTLPIAPGYYSVVATATDRKGGYAQASVSVRADKLGVVFSGFVAGTDTGVLDGATVDVNGQHTVTAIDGSFNMRVVDADRFVLNIRKSGYGLVSQIYDGALMGGNWTMTRATVVTADPFQGIQVADKRDPRNCLGPLSAALNWENFTKLMVPQFQDGKGNVVESFDRLEIMKSGLRGNGTGFPQVGKDRGSRECGPGISIRIPAKSLEDQNGQPPIGPVEVSLSTVDLLSPEQMPGDYTVAEAGGVAKSMESYGAGSIEIAAAGNRKYNLIPGATAEVTIPVDRAQLAAGGTLPATIPILFYDEAKGVWIEEGTAKLAGNAYVGEVKHFSTINTDLVKTNQACVRVDSPTLPPNYKLEVTIPIPGAAPQIITRNITNSSPGVHVIYNLPTNKNIILVPIRIANNTPIGTFIVNTGGTQNPQTPNLPVFGSAPDYYPACATRVVLTDPGVPPPAGEFLHGLTTFAAVNLTDLANSDSTLEGLFKQATADYYQHVDPRGKRLTLSDFKALNGFPGGEIRATFANAGDLGFGRDMHCKKQVSSDGFDDVACYVTNYGDILTPDSQDVVDAVNGDNPVATVAMEFSRVESDPGNVVEFDDPQRVVKFYVYSGDGSQLLRSADLDSGQNLSARPIPQLCMVCHGGKFPPPGGPTTGVPTFNSRDAVKLGSRFLPFDLHYYEFAPPPNDKASQQAAFKQLNEDIVNATQPGPAISEVVAGMYPGATQEENFVVVGWNGDPVYQIMYRDVVARTCRTCHVANSFPDLTFQTAPQAIVRLGNIEQRVCAQGVMPHAKRTHDIFWTSSAPHMPSILQIFGDTFDNGSNGWDGTKCGSFTSGGTTPSSIYVTQVYPVWGSKGCNGCHVGSAPSGGLNLQASNKPLSDANTTFPQIIQSSTELPSMKRIAPFDPANSYLDHKVKNTHLGVGGAGSVMPPGCTGGTCLSSTEIGTLVNWINLGAPPP